MNTFDIRYQLDIMQFSKLPVDPYKEVFADTNHMADKLNLLHGARSSSKTSSYFNSKIKRILFNLLYICFFPFMTHFSFQHNWMNATNWLIVGFVLALAKKYE